ncbi:MAG: DedA family protein, partial [Sarcina sp.]
MSYFLNLVAEYGYILIYILLTIELMGIPFLPGEILIVYCGFLVYQNKLNFILVVLCAAFGVLTGMSLSYFIGKKLGKPFFYKHGKKLHLTHEKMDKFGNLLNKYGTFLIMVICFIPGVKHVIGYLSGISDMKYKKYAPGSFFGAIIWATVFTTIGKLLGDKWQYFHKYIDKYLIVLAIFVIIAVILIYVIKIYREKIIELGKKGIILSIDIFHSLGNLRIVVIIAAVLGVLLVDGFVNIIQGLLSNEFEPFNLITYYLVKTIFGSS